MAAILTFKPNGRQVETIGGTAIGGPVNREADYTMSAINAVGGGRVVQAPDGEVFVAMCRQLTISTAHVVIFKLNSDAVRLVINAPTPGNPVAGETVTQGGTTGTLVQDYEVGDLYVLVDNVTNGPFTTGAVTFSGGDSATISSVEDNGGEWPFEYNAGIIGDGSNEIGCISGWVTYKEPGGGQGIAFITIANDTNCYLVKRNSAGVWSVTNLGGSVEQADNGSGAFVFDQNTIYWSGRTSANTVTWRIVDVVNESQTTHQHFSASCSYITTPVLWNGRVFGAIISLTNSRVELLEITSGTTVVVDTVPDGVGASTEWDQTSPPTLFVSPDDLALYAICRREDAVYKILRWHYDGAAVVRDAVTNSEGTGLETVMASLADPVYGMSFLNLEDTPGSRIIEIYTKSTPTGSLEKLVYNEYVNLVGGAGVTWNGTTTVTFPSNPGLSIGDWIRNNTDNSLWRVTAIGGGSNEIITIDNTLGNTIPSGSAVTSLLQDFTYSSVPSSSGLLMGAADYGDGGSKVFSIGELHISIVGQAAAVGGERLSYKVYGSGTVNVVGYWFNRNTGEYGQMTLASPTGGSSSMNGNTIENVTADDGATTYTVVWGAQTDGFSGGDPVVRYLRVFV